MDMQSNTPPWKQKGMSYRGRLFAGLGFIAPCVLILCPGVPVAYIIFTSSRRTGIFWDDTFPIILILGIIGSALFAIIKRRPSWRAPINITRSYAPIAPSRLGEIFELWHQEIIQGLPYGRGTIVFQASEVILEGYLFRGTMNQQFSRPHPLPSLPAKPRRSPSSYPAMACVTFPPHIQRTRAYCIFPYRPR